MIAACLKPVDPDCVSAETLVVALFRASKGVVPAPARGAARGPCDRYQSFQAGLLSGGGRSLDRGAARELAAPEAGRTHSHHQSELCR